MPGTMSVTEPTQPTILSRNHARLESSAATSSYDMPPMTNDFTSVASSSSPSNDNLPEAPDPAIIDALKNAKERLFVLKMGESMEALVEQHTEVPPLHYAPPTSYQRMLVFRCAGYYKLHTETEGSNKGIFVSRLAESRIPSIRMADLVPSDTTAPTAFKIMRRSVGDKPGRGGRSASADADSDGSEGPDKKKRPMTIAEREAAYNEARSRIFSKVEDREGSISASMSSLSLSTAPSIGESSGLVGQAEDEPSQPQSRPSSNSASSRHGGGGGGGKGSNRRNGGKGDRWADQARTNTPDFDPDFDRSKYNYPNAYEQPAPPPAEYEQPYPPPPAEPMYGPSPYPMYPPYAPYPPPYMAAFPVYYDPRAYPYPPHPQAMPPGADGGPQGNPPYPMYGPGPGAWYPMPPPPQQQQAGPIPASSSNPNLSMSMGQPPPPHMHPSHMPPPAPPSGQHPQQQQQQNQMGPSPYFNPVAAPFYPPQYPPQPGVPRDAAMYPQQQPLPPQVPAPGSMMSSPPYMQPSPSHSQNYTTSSPEEIKPLNTGSSRFSASSRGSSRSNVREAAGTAAVRMGPPSDNHNSPRPRISSLGRSHWSYGSGNSSLGIPLTGDRRSGSSGSRAGSVSSKSGSGGAMTPGDETGSIASSETSSSSSRKTFTSNSSRHPLPARPDWAITLPRGGGVHSRRSSGSSSAFQSVASDFAPSSLADRSPASVLRNFSSGALGDNGTPAWKPIPSRQTSGSASQNGDVVDFPRRVAPTSGGVTLGIASSPLQHGASSNPMSSSLSVSSNSSSRLPTTSSLPPPGPGLPLPPHRAYSQYAQQQQNSKLSDESLPQRPGPKPGQQQGSGDGRRHSGLSDGHHPTSSASPVTFPESAPAQRQSSSSSPLSSEEGDRLRGEAVASAIFIDKLAGLRLSSGSPPVASGAGADERSKVSPLRRATITQPLPSSASTTLASSVASS